MANIEQTFPDFRGTYCTQNEQHSLWRYKVTTDDRRNLRETLEFHSHQHLWSKCKTIRDNLPY
jgi:hypothetical protein